MSCEAYRQEDEMFCPRCNLRWDARDVEPECGKVFEAGVASMLRLMLQDLGGSVPRLRVVK